jgi:gamma-glutamyltranspeptidase/glutathione hydrolase
MRSASPTATIGLLAALLSGAAGPGAAVAQTAAPAAAQAQPETTPTTRFYLADDNSSLRPPADTAATGRAVATAADPLAAEAGRDLLAAGGNAVDAALAMMIALTVVEPQSSGLGGGGFLVWHDARKRRTYTLDGRERAPASAVPGRFLLEDGKPMPFQQAVPGGYSVGVPGALALIADAHKRWGKRPWADLFAPAIRHARSGIIVSPRLHRFIASRQPMLAQDEAAAAIFLDSNGKPWPAGHVLKQPELAASLERIAREGQDVFYKGPIGAQITTTVATAFNNPAALSAQDLAAYRVTQRAPLCRPYRQWTICTMGPPSAGGTAVLQILLQLERFDLRALGPDNLLAQHLFAESQRLAFADREAFGADADFAPVPTQGLLAPDYIAARSALIRPDRAMPEAPAGTPKGAAPPTAQRLADVPGTSHMSAADAAGNLATLTSTIEGPFGSGLVAAGIVLNNQLTDFDLAPTRPDGSQSLNAVEPGKRPRSSMAPTLVFDSTGRPVASFGAAGGATIIAQVAKAIIAHLDWGLPIEDALAYPQLLADRRGLRYEQGSRLEAQAAALKALGHKDVRAAALPLKANAIASVPGGWRGAADPRSEGDSKAIPREGDSKAIPREGDARAIPREGDSRAMGQSTGGAE